jgi:hypothetical protein
MFLSFAHVIHSSIRALADERPAVTPMRVLRPPSPPLRWAVSRAFFFSHSPPSLSFCSPPTRAPQQRRGDQRSPRSTRRSARRKTPPTPLKPGETPRSHPLSCWVHSRTRLARGECLDDLGLCISCSSAYDFGFHRLPCMCYASFPLSARSPINEFGDEES